MAHWTLGSPTPATGLVPCYLPRSEFVPSPKRRKISFSFMVVHAARGKGKLLALRRHQVTTNQLPSDLHAPQDLERTPTVLPQSCTESQDVFTWTLERPNFSKLSNHFKFILL